MALTLPLRAADHLATGFTLSRAETPPEACAACAPAMEALWVEAACLYDAVKDQRAVIDEQGAHMFPRDELKLLRAAVLVAIAKGAPGAPPYAAVLARLDAALERP